MAAREPLVPALPRQMFYLPRHQSKPEHMIKLLTLLGDTQHTYLVLLHEAGWHRPTRVNKRGGWLGPIFLTWEEAHAELIARAEARRDSYALKARQAADELQALLGMAEP
jgi:hypothetical protein